MLLIFHEHLTKLGSGTHVSTLAHQFYALTEGLILFLPCYLQAKRRDSMRCTSPFGNLLVLTASDHSSKFLIELFTLTRQDAFQHHLTISTKHKLSTLIMSQPIQQQQGRTYFQEQEHVPGAHSGQGIGDGGLLYVFSSHLLWMDLAQPSGTVGAQGPHTA